MERDKTGPEAARRYTFSSTTPLGDRFKNLFQARLVKRLARVVPAGGALLEVGAGRGEFAAACTAAGFSYTGMEPSASLARSLVERGFKVVSHEVPRLPFPDGSFDAVHSMDLLEHLDGYGDVLAFLAECLRVLKPGGHIHMVAPNYALLGRLFYEYEYQHTYPTTAPRMTALLGDSGFDRVSTGKFLFPWGLNGGAAAWLDRLAAHLLVPLGRSVMLSSLLRLVAGQDALFRVHKNLFDHVAVLGQKPEE